MTSKSALRQASAILEEASVPDAALDARLLLAHVLQTEPLVLLTRPDTELTAAEEAHYFALIARRAAREPLQYITGVAHIMGHAFMVRPGVLIPRSDSEVLAQRARSLTKPGQTALDVCCGSGALGISLKLARPEVTVWAGDLSPEAIALTKENAQVLGADIHIREGDLFAPFAGQIFDLILCNPPYIPTQELDGLQSEVQMEPTLALNGGADGLDYYRRIFEEVHAYLAPGGSLLLELGDGQAAAVSAMIPPGFGRPMLHGDLSGLPRVLEVKRVEGVN